MKRICELLFSIVLLFSLVPILVTADLGPKPAISLEIMQNGEHVTGQALVCYNNFMAGWSDQGEANNEAMYGKDYPYIKGLIGGKDRTSCSYCYTQKCENWFYSIPSKLTIVYPCYGMHNRDMDSGREITPVIYRSETVQFSRINSYDNSYEAVLNQDGSITLIDKTPVVSESGVSSFITALIITLILEMIIGFIYTLIYTLEKKLPRRILIFVLFGNLISLPIMWFVFPLLIRVYFIYLTISEVFVILLESAILYFFNKQAITMKQSFLLSLCMNLVSFLIGGFFIVYVSMFIGTMPLNIGI